MVDSLQLLKGAQRDLVVVSGVGGLGFGMYVAASLCLVSPCWKVELPRRLLNLPLPTTNPFLNPTMFKVGVRSSTNNVRQSTAFISAIAQFVIDPI